MHPRLQWLCHASPGQQGSLWSSTWRARMEKYIKEVRSLSVTLSQSLDSLMMSDDSKARDCTEFAMSSPFAVLFELYVRMSICSTINQKKIEQSGLKSFQHHNDAHPRRLRKFSESIRTASVSLCWKTAAWWHGGTTVKATSPSIKSYQYAICKHTVHICIYSRHPGILYH